jgi:hypothetical protein
MVQQEATQHWYALTPVNGSYVNGTWSALADMDFWRRYYASGVLKDGRVILCGGEQNGSSSGDTPDCQIYDPVADLWSPISSPTAIGWTTVGDASCCVLPDGRFMIGALYPSTACAIYNPDTDTWVAAASKATSSNEETWILLPDDTILAVQCWSPYQSEKYIISTDTWKNEGTPPVTLTDPVMHEIGPALLMYNKKVIYFGAANENGHGKTAIYTLPASPGGTGAWVAGPDIPVTNNQIIVCNDCPACLLPNGRVFFTAANFLNNNWGSPTLFFEYDPVANSISQAPTSSNNVNTGYPGNFWSRFMLLPTGQVLYSPSINNIQCYTPDGSPQNAWRPVISSIIPHFSIPLIPDYFVLQGSQLNGLSQGNIYGDDCAPCTNYPIVRLKNTTSHQIYFCRTYDFSTRGVTGGAALQSCHFTVPAGLPNGQYELTVIANGISSLVTSFNYSAIKSHYVDVVFKREIEIYGKLVAEGDPFRQDWLIDPAIVEMQAQLNSLTLSVQKLTSLILSRELPEVGKEITERAMMAKDKNSDKE